MISFIFLFCKCTYQLILFNCDQSLREMLIYFNNDTQDVYLVIIRWLLNCRWDRWKASETYTDVRSSR